MRRFALQVEVEPLRQVVRQRRDDQLVVAAEVAGVLDRRERVGIADDRLLDR
jgi:hypothetical protein